VRSIAHQPLAPWFAAGGERAPARGRAKPRVGINWAGNPKFAQDAVRSAHLDQLELLLQVSEVEWCSLHRGHREAEAEAYGLDQPLKDAADFLDTARVIAGLDLVISTETAVPNLSAALGVPTCVLAAPDVDWRWNGWYADVTVCRQDEPGEWAQAVAQALECLAGHLSRTASAA
jgi:ADP-heptose:LPS heptosyltransferase